MPPDDTPPHGPSGRVWRALSDQTRALLERDLSAADLRTLLLDVAAARAETIRPADVLARWREDRFSRPAPSNPREVAAVEAGLWDALPETFVGVELSPVTPLGTVAAVAALSQRRVVTTMRLTEVVSDSTNVLAVEAAARRSTQGRGDRVHLATIQRQLRAQDFGPGVGSHFRLLALVSSARDTGSGGTEADLLLTHLRAWQTLLARTIPSHGPRIEIRVWDEGVVAERVTDTVLPGLAHDVVPAVVETTRERGRGYYDGVALRLTAGGGEVELGDGGLTSWTAQLLQDRKERCLVSCIATERLTELVC